MKTQFVHAIRMYLGLTVILGLLYPLTMTAAAQVFFRYQANGSLLERDGKIIGSRLIAQKFESDRYFKPRPSAVDYNPLPSGGSNLAPTAKKLKDTAEQNAAKFGTNAPQELRFASASGLDPHISPEAALFQVDKVAAARNFDEVGRKRLDELVGAHIKGRDLGFLGEDSVNVLELNLALDALVRGE